MMHFYCIESCSSLQTVQTLIKCCMMRHFIFGFHCLRNYQFAGTVNSEIFVKVLFARNFAFAKFCENKTLMNWGNTLQFADIGKSCHSRKF